MSDSAYLGQTTDLILGQEFLTWLWFRSESNNTFKSADGKVFTVSMEQRIVVQGGEGEALETATVSGAYSELREARLGLTNGKKVTRALVRIEQDPEAWQLTLKAADFSLNSLKTPKIEKGEAVEDDPDGLFFEKIYLIEHALVCVDTMYNDFLQIRLSSSWLEEIKSMRVWLEKTGADGSRAN